MTRILFKFGRVTAVFAVLGLGAAAGGAHAEIVGVVPDAAGVIRLTARCDFISTGDGNSILIWGYAPGAPADGNPAQYPGPTLILKEGQAVTIELFNLLTDELGNLIDENTSMIFPGQKQTDVVDPLWTGTPGLLTREAGSGGQVRYVLQPSHPGTFMYESGTRTQLQHELGLFGALVVRPTGGAFVALPGPNGPFGYASSPGHAYNDADSAFEREYLFLLSEMDPEIHFLVEIGLMNQIDFTSYAPVYWFINGRTAPDVLSPPNAPWLPTQPYNIVPRLLPGERLLMRVVGGSRDRHPFHHHGDHARVIGRDGRMLTTGTGNGADLSFELFTITSIPGQTVDAIFDWMPYKLGWDIYGPTSETCVDKYDNRKGPGSPRDGFDDGGLNAWEWCEDDGVPIPVTLPGLQDLAFGGFWSGSPYLGSEALLPVGEGGLNPRSALTFPWHSHTEKELTNFDIFPGGMLSFLLVEPPGVTTIPQSER